jgi:hypothetical protein
MRVLDFNTGKQLKMIKANAGETITFGSELSQGIYVVVVRQGSIEETLKIVKL